MGMMSVPRGQQHSWSLRSVGDGSGICHPSVTPESLSPECVCVCVCVCVCTCMPSVYLCAHVYAMLCLCVYVCMCMPCVCTCIPCVHMCVMCMHLYATLCVCTCMPRMYLCVCVCPHECHVCARVGCVCVCPCTPSNARSNPIPALTPFQGSLCGGTSLQPCCSVVHAPPRVGAPASRITEGRWG